MPSRTPIALLVAVTAIMVAACGKKPEVTARKDDAATTVPRVAPLTAPPSGVDAVRRMNFVYGDGRAAYDKAMAASKAKTQVWDDVRAQAEAAIAKDPLHLEAHFLLARALAQAGEHASAVDHLVTALANDYLGFGPLLATTAELTEFLATPHGQSLTALAARIKADYEGRIGTGLWLVARRSTFKWPRELGTQYVSTRGELYAYDRPSKRYLRLTHTDHKVAGFVRAPSGTEVAILGFDKIDRPRTGGDDAPPTFARAWVQLISTTDWQPIGDKISLPAARELSLGYAPGDQLVIATAQATGRWTVADPVALTVDKATGKTAPSSSALPLPRIVLTLDEARRVRSVDAIAATWTGTPPTTSAFKTARATIEIPESHAAAQTSMAVAPTSGRVAFATAVDPCADDAAPSLYVAEVTGKLRHLLTAKSRFASRWLDAALLAYEDGEGAIRLWDAELGRQVLKLENKAGIALDVLSLAPAPLCKHAPPVAEPAGSEPGDDALPDEGPITSTD